MTRILGRREIMAYAFTFTACALALLGKITPEQFIPLISVVIGYYFGQRAGQKPQEDVQEQQTNEK